MIDEGIVIAPLADDTPVIVALKFETEYDQVLPAESVHVSAKAPSAIDAIIKKTNFFIVVLILFEIHAPRKLP